MYIVQQQGYGADINNVAKYKTIDLCMICSKNISKKKLAQLNRIDKEIDDNGTMQKLLIQYGIC